MRRTWSILLMLLLPVAAAAQPQPVPQPFPRPGERPPARPPAESPPAPAEAEEDAVVVEPLRPTAPGGEAAQATPTEELLGLPLYPTAEFITSYDAGAGQRFYLFGSNVGFAELVAYYTNRLRQRGNRVFGAPPTHAFEVGRFRQDSMAFPPGVTVKDYTWGYFEGYLNPTPGADTERFATIIQIVPVPPEDR